jgi:hypothetical protein
MKAKVVIGAILLLMAVAGKAPRATADYYSERFSPDFWTRFDHVWSRWELRHAISFCRDQPRVDPSIDLFIDLVQGKQIDRCMRALGWIPVAR